MVLVPAGVAGHHGLHAGNSNWVSRHQKQPPANTAVSLFATDMAGALRRGRRGRRGGAPRRHGERDEQHERERARDHAARSSASSGISGTSASVGRRVARVVSGLGLRLRDAGDAGRVCHRARTIAACHGPRERLDGTNAAAAATAAFIAHARARGADGVAGRPWESRSRPNRAPARRRRRAGRNGHVTSGPMTLPRKWDGPAAGPSMPVPAPLRTSNASACNCRQRRAEPVRPLGAVSALQPARMRAG